MSQIENEPLTLREINCEARRRRILDAARTLIGRAGIAGVSMRKLAQEAGLSVTTLYNLFGSRDDIFVALIEDGIDGMIAPIAEAAPLEADPFERCRAIITVSVRHLEENRSIYGPVMLACYEGLSLQQQRGQVISDRAAGLQEEAIREAIRQGLLRDFLDPAELGRQVYHGYELACVHWAYGLLDEAGFRARALYGLYVALLAVATDETRLCLEKEIRRVERELDAKPRKGGSASRASARRQS